MAKLYKWYMIPEISPLDFMKCCEPIYNVLEKRHQSKTSEDPFIKAILHKDWSKREESRLYQKALEMKIGNFHEELIGKFPDWQRYPIGHSSHCDVGKIDGTIILEVKNRHNTIKGSEGKILVNMLKSHIDNGKRAILVQINCPNGKVNRYGAHPSVEVWNGQEIYTFFIWKRYVF
jgi:hypothetical protein